MFASFLYTTLALAACANAVHITLPLHITTLKQCEQYPINVGGASKLNVEVLNAADECGDAMYACSCRCHVTFDITQQVVDEHR